MKIENKNCIHCEKEARQRGRGTEGAAESEATIRGGLWHLLLWHSHVHLLLCGLYNVVFTLCACVCVTTHIQTNNVIRIAARRSALPL